MEDNPSLAVARSVAAYIVLGLVCLFVIALILKLESAGATVLLFSILFMTLFLACLQVILGLRPVSVFEPILNGVARVVLAYRAPELVLKRKQAESEEILDLMPYLKVDASPAAALRKPDPSA